MTEPTITAEDLSLYALDLLEGEEKSGVELVLRSSGDARKELAQVRGDLALFALGAEQHTPPILVRQRLLKQVAREWREMPIAVPLQDRTARPAPFATEIPGDPQAAAGQRHQASVERARASRGLPPRRTAVPHTKIPLDVPRVVRLPEPVTFGTESTTEEAASDVPVFGEAITGSPSGHSALMFEQQFTAKPGDRTAALPAVPGDPALNPRRRTTEEALDAVQDRFARSGEDEEPLAFAGYRGREEEHEPRRISFGRLFAWSGWMVAAAVAIAAVFTLRDDFNLREQAAGQQTALSTATADAAKAESILQTLQNPSSQRFVLARAGAAPAPSARVAYLPDRGTLVFQASNLETLQPYKTYELWLIPAGEGKQPVPAGTFKPDGRGSASVLLPFIPKGLVAGNFGVTIEDEGGSPTPTLPIVLVGQPS